ncbi:MAG: hypothetical protein ACXAB5_04975 [Candidatus Thorarchaeota archaeon]|jgi:hypothetical protein
MTQLNCPNCDGPVDVPPQSSTVVCAYCSTTIQVKTGDIIKENYVMRLQYSLDEAREKMLSWAMKQLGAPKGLENAKVRQSELTFWPFWVVEVEAKANYQGTQKKPKFDGKVTISTLKSEWVPETGEIEMEKDIFIPANNSPPKELGNYVIPTKRKEYYMKDMIVETGGALKPIQVDREKAIQIAQKRMDNMLRIEAHKEVDKIQSMEKNLNVPAVFIVSIPVWHIKYRHSVRNYDALIDGASGRVIYLEYPRKMAFRATVMLGGLIHLVAGGGLGLFLVYLGVSFYDGIFPTVIGIMLGLGMLAISIRFFQTAFSLQAGIEEVK